jgi:hypothetical protein
MNHIRPSYVALAILTGTLIAEPANAWPSPGGSPMPTPSPSVNPNFNVPRVEIPRPDVKPKLTTERWNDKRTEKVNEIRNNRDDKTHTVTLKDKSGKDRTLTSGGKPLEVDESNIEKVADALLRKEYEKETEAEYQAREEVKRKLAEAQAKLQATKDAAEQWRRDEEWKQQQKVLREKAEERERERKAAEAEAEKKRQAENAPVDWQEKIRRDRVNNGKERPRPGDENQPWFSPNYDKGETPWNNPTK